MLVFVVLLLVIKLIGCGIEDAKLDNKIKEVEEKYHRKIDKSLNV